MGAIIGIFSAKGGVGKTLLASNLAAAFSLLHRVPTALIDLAPGTGTADLLLDLEPTRSWVDLKNVIGELTAQHIQLAVTPHHPGLDLLASPAEIAWDQSLSRTDLGLLLEAFRKEYDLVLVDVPSGGSDLEQFALGIVDLRLVLVTPDAPALQATNRYLKWISEIDSPTKLVINQQSQGAAVAPAEIKNHLGNNLVGVLPIDPQGVWANVSYGKPCSLCKTSKLGAAIRRLSERLLKMINLQP